MAFPAIAAAAASKGGAAVTKLLDYPVIGIRRKEVKITKRRTVETDASIQLRGWELAVAGVAAALVYYAYNGGFGNGTKDISKLNPLDPLGVTGPVGDWAWRLSPGGAIQALISGSLTKPAPSPAEKAAAEKKIKESGSPWYPIPGLVPGPGGGWMVPP